jgi:APA family basic amino acid/polyamine antiporter
MLGQQLFVRKSIERLHKEMHGDNRLRRVLGPISLTGLGVGAIIGAGIFVITGRTAADNAGPAVLLSFLFAGFGCGLAALCYAEFASMAPVAGSAYTYAYATLGELFAWIIGWDLILEYAMSCGVLAADWTKYFNEFLNVLFHWEVPEFLSNDPFSTPHAWFSLPAVLIMASATIVLVIGIRESATTNAVMVFVKLGVVLFVIAVGVNYINSQNWTSIPPEQRKFSDVQDLVERRPDVAAVLPFKEVDRTLSGEALFKDYPQVATVLTDSIVREIDRLHGPDELRKRADLARFVPVEDYGPWKDLDEIRKRPDFRENVQKRVEREITKLPSVEKKWGMISVLGLHSRVEAADSKTRSSFLPFGVSGIMVAAALVFFAYIGFDSISTHAEEAKKPQRDVPIGILCSLALCTILYFGVSAVITGMEPYPVIDRDAAVAKAFRRLSIQEDSWALRISAGVIAVGALAGMTSVILVTLLSQARIFLAMARDGLLSERIFGAVHPRFKTPHLSTMLTGGLLCVVTALTPLDTLENMVNIGTLLAFIIVCASVLILRIRRPDAPRPFRCPIVYLLAPLGILVNLTMMLFLPLDTWWRLLAWLVLGLVIYFAYGRFHSVLGRELATNGRVT